MSRSFGLSHTRRRTSRHGLFGVLVLTLTISGAVLTQAAAAAPSSTQSNAQLSASVASSGVVMRKKQKAKKRKKAARRPASFARRTVRATRGINKVTVSWPARPGATSYTVVWSSTRSGLPKSPSTCRYPCQKRWTTGTSMVLTSAAMSTPGRKISSASGNAVMLKIFSHNSRGMNWTGITYPWDAFIAPANGTAVDWLPVSSSQIPSPLPAKAGRQVAVSSFNVLAASAGRPVWSSRVAKVVRQINGTGSSIVATQENSNVNTGVSGRIAQYKDLGNRLRPSGWALADGRDWDRAIGKARSDSTQAVRIYYKTGQWKQLSNGALMTRAGFAGQTSGVNVDRWVSWTRLQSRASSRTKVCVVSAHLLSNYARYGRASAVHRNAEMAQILSELNNPKSKVRRVGTRLGAACGRTPIVFAGDLNAAQEHAYGNMPQSTALGAGFVDTKNAARRLNTRLSGPGPIGRWHAAWGTQIDYLLTRGMGGAKAFKVNSVAPRGAGSDHYPVTALVSVPNS